MCFGFLVSLVEAEKRGVNTPTLLAITSYRCENRDPETLCILPLVTYPLHGNVVTKLGMSGTMHVILPHVELLSHEFDSVQ